MESGGCGNAMYLVTMSLCVSPLPSAAVLCADKVLQCQALEAQLTASQTIGLWPHTGHVDVII
jgi:hypothetical protein